MTSKEIVEKIRTGELDPNNSQNFFATLIRALLLNLNKEIKIRDVLVPHMIINTGDDTMWLLEKEYDYSKEPCDATNEQYIYNIVPRGVVNLGGIDALPDQLTNPYTRGSFQFDYDGSLYTFNSEFRRVPVKLQVTLKYLVNTFSDVLELVQHFYTKLIFVRTFKFVYMGNTIVASYKLPESLSDEHQTEIDRQLAEERDRQIEIQLEVESNIPVYEPRTVVENIHITHPIIKNTINHNETIERDLAPRADYRSFGSRKGSH